ncbi:hypothetical protein [Fodinibius roseus]|nr:hypothetical protein [Fodinibius roseus]
MDIENNERDLNFESSNAYNTNDPNNKNSFWINAGIGVGTPGIAGIASASYQFLGSNLLSLRGAITGELFGDELWDIGLLYGRATTAQDYHASISAGLAVMGGSRSSGGLFSDTPREEVSRQVGFPIGGQLFWLPSRFIGLGLSGFANLNGERSFAGLAFSLQIGKLK